MSFGNLLCHYFIRFLLTIQCRFGGKNEFHPWRYSFLERKGRVVGKIKMLSACPVETTLTLISDQWKVLILRDLMTGTKRFGELKKSIGHVSQKVLTTQLRQMEASGLLSRKVWC